LILVVASEFDPAIGHVRADPACGDVAFLTPSDLCRPGWCVRSATNEPFSLIAGDRSFASSAVCGVLSLLPVVSEMELLETNETDRPYVASELSAFLFHVLTRLHCKMASRPTPYDLSGPGWRHAQWHLACHRAGVPVVETGLSSIDMPTIPEQGRVETLTVVDGSVVDGTAKGAPTGLARLARIAGASVLSARVECNGEDWKLRGVSTRPDLSVASVRRAVFGWLCDG